jgi:hypothetical protein
VSLIEIIDMNGRPLAYLIRADVDPAETTFPMPPSLSLQVGFVVYPKGGEVQRHVHLPVDRHISNTSEVLVVRRGACEVDFYDEERRELVATAALQKDDILLIVAGGHGLRMLQDTVLLEVKQGPYTGPKEKERF